MTINFEIVLLILIGVIFTVFISVFYITIFLFEWIENIIDKRKEGNTYLFKTELFRINFNTRYSIIVIELGRLGGKELTIHLFNKWGWLRLIDIVYLPWPRTYVSK